MIRFPRERHENCDLRRGAQVEGEIRDTISCLSTVRFWITGPARPNEPRHRRLDPSSKPSSTSAVSSLKRSAEALKRPHASALTSASWRLAAASSPSALALVELRPVVGGHRCARITISSALPASNSRATLGHPLMCPETPRDCTGISRPQHALTESRAENLYLRQLLGSRCGAD